MKMKSRNIKPAEFLLNCQLGSTKHCITLGEHCIELRIDFGFEFLGNLHRSTIVEES